MIRILSVLLRGLGLVRIQGAARGGHTFIRYLALGLAGLVLSAPAARAQFSPGPLSKAHHAYDSPIQCTRCHTVVGGNRKFKCLSCHVEIRQRLAERRGLHRVMLGGNQSEQECARCHSEHNGENFVPIRWDVSLDEFDHRKTGYPLEGKHAGLACRRCHAPEYIRPEARRGIQMKDLRRSYLGLSGDCATCHADPHFAQLGTDCRRCHEVSGWKNLGRFDHAAAKFKLNGAHEKVACRKCHAQVPDPKPHIQFTGLAFNQCRDCHKDPHRGAFAAPCQSCHSDRVWKPAHTNVSFDHSKTKFPLLGRHAGLVCEKCHRTSDFKQPVAHERCADCHRDPHKSQFVTRADRGECGSCHTVESWKPSTFTAAQHARTSYPLEGRHGAVACAKCHIPAGADTVYKVKSERCADCHQDPHRGQFASTPDSGRCEGCHTLKGFRPSTFTLTRHGQTRFPLAGAHAAVTCMECHHEHAFPPSPGRYRFDDLRCEGCHEDPHKGQFRVRMAAAGAGGSRAGCQACHTVQAWRDVSRFDHATTGFLLTGAHRAVACQECHRPPNLALGLQRVNFQAAPKECAGCHEDIHGGQFTGQAGARDCSGCHLPLKWKPTTFDHDQRSTFPLTGAHKDVACRLCHKTRREINGRVVLVYRPAPKECSACHGSQIID